MDKEQLQERFPNLRPISSAPSLATFNGIGLSIYGARDHDAETGTYIKTRFFTAVFFPLFALDAYRVAKAENGWYFLGKEPLSGVAKAWNAMLALLLVMVIAVPQWNAYTTSPAYLAEKNLEQAHQELGDGKLTQAIRTYSLVASGATPSTSAAQKALTEIFTQRLPSAAVADAVNGLAAIVALPKHSRRGIADDNALIGFAKQFMGRTDDPRSGLLALDAITTLVKPEEKAALREPLLVALVAKEPTEPKPASELAELYEGRGENDRCEALLTPVRAKLGSLEGARILGRIDAAKGRTEESYQLLFPYCKDRLKALQTVEKHYQAEQERAWKTASTALNNGAAGDAWYRKHKGLNEKAQGELVDTWMLDHVKRNAAYNQALDALRKAGVIVPVALDLGVVTLQRAQTLSDPAARKKELEAAEHTFIAIKGLAGESDEYHLSYGQVCFWLGKHDDGQKEFDALLEKNQRANLMLLRIAQIMREVGAMDRARALCEEAYNKSKIDEERFAAANLRALSLIDNEDSLVWLERADPHNPWVMCNLNFSRGRKALENGDNEKAAIALRACIAGYEAMPKSAGTLNNGALAAHALFQITGKTEDIDKANRWLEEASAIEPDDSILMDNLADHLMQAGVMAVIGDRIDQVALRMVGDTDLLSYCYRDQAGADELAAKLRANATVQRSVKYYEKLLVLAPKSPGVYSTLRTYYLFTEDLAGMRTLHERLIDAHLDQERNRQDLQDLLSGKNDQRFLAASEARARFLNALLGDSKLVHPSVTASVVLNKLVENNITIAYLGGERDNDLLVTLAEKANAEADSLSTHNTRIHTLLARALRRASAKTPSLAMLLHEQRRTLSDNMLMILVCGDAFYRSALIADSDLIQAVVLLKQRLTALPQQCSPDEWALLTALNDPAAATCADILKRDEVADLAARIKLELQSLRPDNVINAWWRKQALGDQAAAAAILATAKQQKVPLPPQVQ